MTGSPDTRSTPPSRRWRVLLRLGVGALGTLGSVAVLLLFFAWLAVRVPWEVPDRAALTGPTVVVDRDGNELARFTSAVDRRVVSLEEISPAARNAIIAAEDVRFYEHTGVDPISLVRAVVSNVRTGGISQGGSTLTQQYVKNAYLSPEQTITRKVREAVISIALERRMDKDEILASYLNEVYFGELAWGIEAAAITYFGVPAAELTAGQGATLAQLLPAPSARNPRTDPDGAVERRNRVLDVMAQQGMITRATADAEQERPLDVLPRRSQARDLPVFVEYVRRQLLVAYGEEAVLTGALRVTATVDRAVQDALDAAVAEHLPADEVGTVEAAAVAIDPRTGAILAIHPGAGYGEDSSIDLATQFRPIAGSTFKPFAYLAALQQGMRPTDMYPAPREILPTNCPPDADGNNPFRQPVSNAGNAAFGRLSLQDALARSVNTVFVQLGCDVGPERIVETADWLGVRTPLEPAPLISLGNPPRGPTVLDLASAFATLANDGLHCPAHAIAEVRGPDGSILPRPDEVVIALEAEALPRRHDGERLGSRPEALKERDRGDCYAVADADHVRATTQALIRVVTETTGRRAALDRPVAGKTGTADNETFALFAGYTPELALAVQVSDPLRDPERVAAGEVRGPMRDIAGFARVQGGTIPALIWRTAAAAILADTEPSEFEFPNDLDHRRVGPADPKPEITEEPTPEPTETDGPGGPGDPGTTEPPDGQPPDDDDDDPCFLIFCP
jgi:membrane peptidoglycan carboxypeptidase